MKISFPYKIKPINPDIASVHGRLTADELFVFVKICALHALQGNVPSGTFKAWRLLVPLVCGLLHYEVPKLWVASTSETGMAKQIEAYIAHHKEVFGLVRVQSSWFSDRSQLISLFLTIDHLISSYHSVQLASEFPSLASPQGKRLIVSSQYCG